jgi:glyoxylase-like metal-dependent hydrolase (beta-lactamase superfamily II)
MGTRGQDGLPGPEGPQGPEGPLPIDPALPAFDKVIAGLGGQAVLDGFTGFELEAAGDRFQPGEAYLPDAQPPNVSSYDAVVSWDRATSAWRCDWGRSLLFIGGVPLTYSEIINDDVGSVSGVDTIFGFSSGDMLSSRWGAVVKQHTLLNPHILIVQAIANPMSIAEAGVGVYDGVLHEILEVADPIANIQLWVRPSTGHISKLVTMENDHLHRDSLLEVYYSGWQRFDDGPSFPRDVVLALGGQVLATERRSAVDTNPMFAAGTFDLPMGAAPVFDAALADWGRRSSQFLNQFGALGLPLDAVQTFVMPMQLAPGVFFLGGGTHNSMAIEQANGVVIVEAPLYPERSEAILDWAETQFPGKPVTHVVATHFHEDHSAGLRAFVANGAVVVNHEDAVGLFADVFRAPSTIVPDALETGRVRARFMAVERFGSLTLPDATNPVVVFDLPTTHSGDMVFAFLPNGGFVFESDLYNPGNGGTAFFVEWATDLRDAIAAQAPGAMTLVGGHGGVAPLQELIDFLP